MSMKFLLQFKHLKTREHQEPAWPQRGRVIKTNAGGWIWIQRWRNGPGLQRYRSLCSAGQRACAPLPLSLEDWPAQLVVY